MVQWYLFSIYRVPELQNVPKPLPLLMIKYSLFLWMNCNVARYFQLLKLTYNILLDMDIEVSAWL